MSTTATPTRNATAYRSLSVEDVDFIQLETDRVRSVLEFLDVACRALSGANEVHDGIGSTDVEHAWAGLAPILVHINESVEAINRRASGDHDATGEELAHAVVEYFGDEEIDELLDMDIQLRDMARAIVAKAGAR